MSKVNAISRFFRAVSEVVRVLMQNFQHSIPGKQIVVQRDHFITPEAGLLIEAYEQ
jgi:hypothetical protein